MHLQVSCPMKPSKNPITTQLNLNFINAFASKLPDEYFPKELRRHATPLLENSNFIPM
jgi:hypothetical protein